MKSRSFITSGLLIVAVSLSMAQSRRTENLVIVTLDGFRWQEVFNGADSAILFNKEYTSRDSDVNIFWNKNSEVRRETLLPFLWQTIAAQGQVYGNRAYGNQVNCANPYWFSYPGYSEMLTGIVDRKMASNRKVENPNANVLEFINQQQGYEGRVAAFSTWDVIPYIIRATSNGIITNNNEDIICLENKAGIPAPPVKVRKRCDETTFRTAFEFVKVQRPKVMFLSFDGTDEHSHAGRYGEYLTYANKADQMIRELWDWMQSQECYKDKTTFIVTTDHGRGRSAKGSWKTHGRWAVGSNQMWMAVIGPDTPPLGEMKNDARYYQKQIAKTAAAFLGMEYAHKKIAGQTIMPMITTDQAVTFKVE